GLAGEELVRRRLDAAELLGRRDGAGIPPHATDDDAIRAARGIADRARRGAGSAHRPPFGERARLLGGHRGDGPLAARRGEAPSNPAHYRTGTRGYRRDGDSPGAVARAQYRDRAWVREPRGAGLARRTYGVRIYAGERARAAVRARDSAGEAEVRAGPR